MGFQRCPNDKSLLIYPNPVGEYFQIKNTSYEIIEIYNTNGIRIMTIDEKDKEQINVSFLPSGLYIISLRGK